MVILGRNISDVCILFRFLELLSGVNLFLNWEIKSHSDGMKVGEFRRLPLLICNSNGQALGMHVFAEENFHLAKRE